MDDFVENILTEPAADTEQIEAAADNAAQAAPVAENEPAAPKDPAAPESSESAEPAAPEPAVDKPADGKGEITVPSQWFTVGQKVRAQIDGGKTYETIVRGLLEDQLYLDIPLEGNGLVVPKVGSVINAHFILNNSVYFFDAVLFGLKRLDVYPVWILSMPADFKRVQRRNFLRLDIILPVRVRVETRAGVFMPTVKTNCLDISCGGVRYVLDYPVDAGKLVKLEADTFPGVGNLQALCKVVRSAKSEVSEENYWIGAQFSELPHKIENKIARHIFQIQRRIMISSSSE